MLTYLLHERVFKGEEGKQLEFPNTLLVTAKLSPPVIFGKVWNAFRSLGDQCEAATSPQMPGKRKAIRSPNDVEVMSFTTTNLLSAIG